MKNILFVICLLATTFSYSQDCKNYYYLQNNKTIEITMYNSKGEMNGRQVYTVSNFQNSGTTASATVNTEMFNKKGKSISKSSSVMKCSGGVMMMDMKLSLPQQQAEQFSADAKTKDFYLEYPASMKIGDNLKDGNMEMSVDSKGMTTTLNMSVTNRKVEGQEKITTTAGSWDCFKITYHTKIITKVMGMGIPINMDVTEWYAPGFGVVKTSSKYGETVLTAIN
jgi:hypothetical protein